MKTLYSPPKLERINEAEFLIRALIEIQNILYQITQDIIKLKERNNA